MILNGKMKQDFEKVYQAQNKENSVCQLELKVTARKRVSKCDRDKASRVESARHRFK